MKLSTYSWVVFWAFIAAVAFVCALVVAFAPVAKAAPDIAPPNWCPGGGALTAWGGYCDGATYPDNTKWHQDSFWAPFVGRVWNPIVCVVANAPAPPPLAPPSGCGRG